MVVTTVPPKQRANCWRYPNTFRRSFCVPSIILAAKKGVALLALTFDSIDTGYSLASITTVCYLNMQRYADG
jgi:hypothetical protein